MLGDMFTLVINVLLLLHLGVAVHPADVMVLGGQPRATLLTDREPITKKCRYNHPFSMLQARCADLGLQDIPKNLRTDIKILDISVNRLRELKNDTLSAYTSLAYLYLQDNFIQTIEEGTFDPLRRLETIDLTKNGCQDFPKSTLGLPYLRKLFLSDNKLKDDSFVPTSLSRESNLEFLELSMNQLKKLPSLGSLPSLKFLNVSKNFITRATTEDLANFCSLEILDLTKNPIKFNETSCDCRDLNLWIETRGIKMKPLKFDCGKKDKNLRKCADSIETGSLPNFSNETTRLFDTCRNVMEIRVETEKARSTWILVASCLGFSLVIIFFTLFCIHKRNNRKKERLRLQKQLQIASNNANTELLNGNVLTEQN